jgi:nuclease S1
MNNPVNLPLLLLCWLSFSAPLAHAWGEFAHRVIGRVAERHLSPHAQKGVRVLLGSQTLADVSDDADEWRSARPQTSPWHYVNIPFAATTYVPARDCPRDNCVIAAIERYRSILADEHQKYADRREALVFLVHLVADLHQPLHCINNNDRGGNDVAVSFFGKPATLHSVWDFDLLARTRLPEHAYVKRLRKMMATRNAEKLRRGTVSDWALESHGLAKERAYRLPLDSEIRSDYYGANIPVVDNQLIKAAVRLAWVLNEVFARGPASGSPSQPGEGIPSWEELSLYVL